MSYLDIIFAVPLAWAIYRGATKGAIRQVAQLTALLLGIWGALRYSGDATALILRHYEPGFSESTLFFLCFGVLFVLIVMIVHLFGKLIDRIARIAMLGMVNRILGAVFCLAKYILILAVLTGLAERADRHIPYIPQEQKEQSLLYEPFLRLFEEMIEFTWDA